MSFGFRFKKQVVYRGSKLPVISFFIVWEEDD